MLYFAYGSNMDWVQMSERCSSARFISTAVLPDHRLAFTRESKNRKCGVADALRAADRQVWGVVFEISDADAARLDRFEGYQPGRERNSYWRRECTVLLGGDEARPQTVATYFAEPQPRPPLPNQGYKDLIVSGARHWKLPVEYIADLERIEVDG